LIFFLAIFITTTVISTTTYFTNIRVHKVLYLNI
jgi:hypothetical protein